MGVKTFCKLTTAGNKRCYLVSEVEDHGKEGIKLTMSDGESAWSGELTGDDLEDLSHKIKMKFSDFLAETVKAFTRENVGNLNFLYQIRTCNDGDAMELTWKKYVAVDDIKFQLGKVVLESMPDPAKFNQDVFTYCIENMVELKSQINSLQTDNQRLSQERGQALKRLDKSVTAKEDVEKDLYSKFVAVLNSKKEKIRELKREIDEGGAKSNGNEEKAVASSSTTRLTDEDVEMSDQDTKVEDRLQSDEDRTTDDEVTPPPKRRRGGANVKHNLSSSADNSLVLDDGEDIQPSAASRRPRRQASGKKATPSKPVLPRVRSGDREHSASDRRTSIRKSGSGSSSKSASEVVDADDLLNDL